MILESIVTTRNEDGSLRVAPMGPVFHADDARGFELRPFPESGTFRNLARSREGVMHVTDDAMLFVQAALGTTVVGRTRSAETVTGTILADCCRAFEFRVVHMETSGLRASLQCDVVQHHRFRDFFGFNRARHLLIELAILVTRMDFIPAAELASRLDAYGPVIEKTGDARERQALQHVVDFLEQLRRRSPWDGADSTLGAAE